jgi:hypothetical protein
MRRLTDKDYHFGPFTWAHTDSKAWEVLFSTGGDNDDEYNQYRNHLKLYAFGWIVRLCLPNLVSPWKKKVVVTSWDEATVKRLGRNWYWDMHPREYGVRLNDGFLQLFYGPQTHDSETTKSKSWVLPWTQWTFVRKSWYDSKGVHLKTLYEPKDRSGYSAYSEEREYVNNLSLNGEACKEAANSL